MQQTIQTTLANDIDATVENITLDNQIKVVLSNKAILARILSQCMKEFSGMDYDTIVNCIEGEPEVGSVPINPGLTNQRKEKISGEQTENIVPKEGMITFDIRFFVRIPRKDQAEAIKILVNIEAQKSYYPGYDIVTRAIFYCARMLSSQLSTEFTVSNDDPIKYNNIKKVYSIWICMDTSKKAENTIDEYYFTRHHLIGENRSINRYDLMSVIMICLGKNLDSSTTENELLKMLSTLLNTNISAEEKKRSLEQDYGIPMTKTLAEGVDDMCNISEFYKEIFMEQGMQQGMKQNIEFTVEKLLKKSYSTENIADMLDLDLDYVKKIEEKLSLSV